MAKIFQSKYTGEEIEFLLDTIHQIIQNGSLVVKGNVYPTLDGELPTHAGPPTKNAGNVLMPYARAVGGFTKDKTGVRTIGLVAKPSDIFKDIKFDEFENVDSVFLGTDASQTFIYSRDKYPMVVSQGEMSSMATQSWVYQLLSKLDLMPKEETTEQLVSAIIPTEVFDLNKKWHNLNPIIYLNDNSQTIAMTKADRYTPLFAKEEYNDFTFIAPGKYFTLWNNDSYYYAVIITSTGLQLMYIDAGGGGKGIIKINQTFNFDFNTTKIRAIYDKKNDVWNLYTVSEYGNIQNLLITVSRFMFEGHPLIDSEQTKAQFGAIMYGSGISSWGRLYEPQVEKENLFDINSVQILTTTNATTIINENKITSEKIVSGSIFPWQIIINLIPNKRYKFNSIRIGTAGKLLFYNSDNSTSTSTYVETVVFKPTGNTIRIGLNFPSATAIGYFESFENPTVYEQTKIPPTIIANNKTLEFGEVFNPLDGITATDTYGNDITSKITVVKNEVDINKAGTYYVEYQVEDDNNMFTSKIIIVTVKPKNYFNIETPLKKLSGGTTYEIIDAKTNSFKVISTSEGGYKYLTVKLDKLEVGKKYKIDLDINTISGGIRTFVYSTLTTISLGQGNIFEITTQNPDDIGIAFYNAISVGQPADTFSTFSNVKVTEIE